MSHASVYLVPVGADRFELYAEPPVEPYPSDDEHGRLARWRRRATRLAARAAGDERTLWSLRRAETATLVHPSTIDSTQAASVRDRLLESAAAHHVRRLALSGAALVPAALLTVVPGPNVIAYLLAGRGVGHYISWRGAKRAVAVRWEFRSEPALDELGGLAALPPETRASRVQTIAARLRLPSLAAFFDRAAAAGRS